MEDEEVQADAPMIKDIRHYIQGVNFVADERYAAQHRNTDFLTPEETKWYNNNIEKYRKEFGLRPQQN